jgi:hypothetical protein
MFDRFWRIFKDTLYFRLSWRIQDYFLSSYRKEKERLTHKSINDNIDDITDKVYNNKFSRSRKKK